MSEAKFRIGFLSFFFFFQGVFLTGMILLALFDHRIVPVMKEKNTQIELLVNELNSIKNRNHKHFHDGNSKKIHSEDNVI